MAEILQNGRQNGMLAVVKLDPRATLPTVAHPGEDLAYDLYALEGVCIRHNELAVVRTGIAARFFIVNSEKPYGLLIRDRSSLAIKGITVSGGVIDAGYTGEIKVLLRFQIPSFSGPDAGFRNINTGDKIAQMIPMEVLTSCPIIQVDTLENYFGRGSNGFGSSGR
jgi:dUTP pyrophosphatase